MTSKEEKIGFHKGCIDTLLKERQELIKIIEVTEQLVKIHVQALKELGVDLEKQIQEPNKKV